MDNWTTNVIRIGSANAGIGQVTLSNGNWVSRQTALGLSSGSQGTMTIAGGTNTVTSSISVAEETNSTASVWLNGGRLMVTNATTIIGARGTGQMTISNGVFLGGVVRLATNLTARGTLTVANTGTMALTGPLEVGSMSGSTSTVWITGGQLVVTNTPSSVGAGSGFAIDGSVIITNNGAINVSNLNTAVGNAGNGTLSIRGGKMSVGFGSVRVGNVAGTAGAIWMTDTGTLIMTNSGSSLFVGNLGSGQMTMSNGTVNTSSAIIGNVGPARGTLTLAGGVFATTTSEFDVGENTGSTGAVWVTGGTLLATNSNQSIGLFGVGQLTVSNGIVQLRRVLIAFSNVGTFTIAGGTNLVTTEFHIGFVHTGTVWMTGGQLFTTNALTTIGQFGAGQMNVSNGMWQASNVFIAANAGAQGTLTVAGGTNNIYSGMTLGTFACNATGTVVVAGGNLFDQCHTGRHSRRAQWHLHPERRHTRDRPNRRHQRLWPLRPHGRLACGDRPKSHRCV